MQRASQWSFPLLVTGASDSLLQVTRVHVAFSSDLLELGSLAAVLGSDHHQSDLWWQELSETFSAVKMKIYDEIRSISQKFN